jgi:hypothetical protein
MEIGLPLDGYHSAVEKRRPATGVARFLIGGCEKEEGGATITTKGELPLF